jgi:DNA replication protein DnaC
MKPEPGVCDCGNVLNPIEFPLDHWKLANACDACIYFRQFDDQWRRPLRAPAVRFDLHLRTGRPPGLDGYACPPGDVAAYEVAKAFRPKGDRSLYLYGKSGTGKTHLALMIALNASTTRQPVVQEVARANMPDEIREDVATRLELKYPDGCPWYVVGRVEAATVPELLAAMRIAIETQGQSPDRIREELVSADLLVLDDLGTEKITHWTREILFDILDRRFEGKRPTVITSNLDLAELERRLTTEPGDPYGERIASRIAGSCVVLEVKAADYRRKK